jgi:hypothetical protein
MFAISRKLIFKSLLILAGSLLLLSIAGQCSTYFAGHPTVFGLVDFFYVGGEKNLPTFFSVILMLMCSLLLFTVYLNEKPLTSKKHNAYWLLLALIFIFLACDEFTMLHEHLDIISYRLGIKSQGLLHFSWVLPGMLIIGVLGLFLLKFMLSLPSTTRNQFILAGTVYLAGVIGVEMIDGAYFEQHGRTFGYTMLVALEESLEMLGLILFIHALLNYLSTHHQQIITRFVK